MHPDSPQRTVAVIGGAGYIGSHTARALAAAGRPVVVVDNLSTGHIEAARFGAFVKADISETEMLQEVFARFQIDSVFHFAASAYVGESVVEPEKYYKNNVAGSVSLLEAMRRAGVKKIVFSSTCSLYGETADELLTEEHAVNPMNPYARTKLCIEWVLRDYASAYGMRHVCLRYFNAAGAAPDASLGEFHDPETHLIPLVLRAALDPSRSIRIFGTDYPTPDGTCIRDYIHICDLAEAHLLALKRLDAGLPSEVFNLGNGKGHSVREVIDCARLVSGRPIAVEECPRRRGDPPKLVGSSERACAELGWRPQFSDLRSIMETAWNWERKLEESSRGRTGRTFPAGKSA